MRAVHPRSRGKYNVCAVAVTYSVGSSPLAREIQTKTRQQVAILRFIPARAGNTMLSQWGASIKSVHPRSRGKYNAYLRDKKFVDGSSPLAREIHIFGLVFLLRWRFIPARAGNTIVKAFITHVTPVHPRSRGKYPS